MTFHRFLMPVVLLLACAACSAPPAPSPTVAALPLDLDPLPTATAAPTHTPAPSSTPLPPEPTPSAVSAICSPLEGLTLDDLHDILSNPYNPPRPGFDEPHHGVDFAYYRYRDRIGMLGLPVYAVVPGVVAGVVHDRFPYGNTLIIETPLIFPPPGCLKSAFPPQPPRWCRSRRSPAPIRWKTPAGMNPAARFTPFTPICRIHPPSNPVRQCNAGSRSAKWAIPAILITNIFISRRVSAPPTPASSAWRTTSTTPPKKKCVITALGASAAPSRSSTPCNCLTSAPDPTPATG